MTGLAGPVGGTAVPAKAFTGTERFRPVAFVGQGSMGVVYRVHDSEAETDVALKTLDTHEPDDVYFLKQEFRTLSEIAHPNLVELYDLVVSAEQSFFTMEFIEGMSFTEYARSVCACDDPLRSAVNGRDLGAFLDAAQQLVRGLSAVHAAGKLHRDVKPPNILVTQGRVVLLDFGLATALGREGLCDTVSAGAAGTLAYMAPEQAWGAPPDPTADWYSVGVVLYEALTGRLPFAGPAARMLLAKSKSAPLPLRAVVPDIPEALDALIIALLNPDPVRRPGAGQILSQLKLAAVGSGRVEVEKDRAATSAAVPAVPAEPPFVGRVQEMATLCTACEAVRAGHGTVVHIQGVSGIGKTELIRRFLLSIEGDAVILRGRCHPQEAVPYKALDAVVDALSRLLISLPASRASDLVPRHIGALTRLFPVLARVPALSGGADRDDTAEPYEIRRRGFNALRELLARIADRQPLIMWIDDLQWGDLDSAQLLRELMQAPDAPAMLLLLSYRNEDLNNVPLLTGLESHPETPSASSHEIRLGPLTTAETRELATLLCDRHTAREQCIAVVAQESQGSPFFLGQLIQHLTATAPLDTSQVPPSLSLRTVLTDRVHALPVSARHLLELVCIAARPLERRFALNAAEITERGLPIIINLEQARLLRPTTLGGLSAVEVYHDRIREVIVAGLRAEDARARHRQIADAFARLPEPDPQELFTHYLGAGLDEVAGQYAEQAGDLAARALAFDRAAELYRQALQLQRGDRVHWSLPLRRAEALANAGRGREAGESFEASAAALAQQSPEHDDVVSLRRRAAEQYLRSGHIDRGTALMDAVLGGLGVRLPRTSGRAMVSSMFHRCRFLLRGTRFEPASTRVAARARLRLEALWAGSTGLLVSNPVLSDGLGVRCLIQALKVGERSQMIRTLGLEAVREACMGGTFFQRRSARLLHTAEDMARGSEDPYASAWVRHCRGTSAYFCGHWQTARAECDASLAMLREQCRGVAWEVVTAESFAITALAHMGAIRPLSWRLPAAVRDGDQRGDVYAATSLRMGVPSILWLAQDHADDCRRMAAEAISRWPSTTFLVQHYLHLIASVQAELYLGDAWAAWRHVHEAWPRLRSAHILATVAVARVELRYLRARAALATAACRIRTPSPRPDWSPKDQIRLAAEEARRLSTELLPSAKPYATMIRARIASLHGLQAQAIDLLMRAATEFEQADMQLHRAAARYCEGLLRRGDEGRRLCGESESWMHAETIQRPVAMVGMLCAGSHWSTSGFSS